MGIDRIIRELLQQNILPSSPLDVKKLSGGTESQLHLLKMSDGSNFVVKQNKPQVLEAEAQFLTSYKDVKLLPNLLFVEPTNQYIVYSFIDGSTQWERKNKKDILSTLVKELINHYKMIENPKGWGWADQPTTSWEGFLLDEICDAQNVLRSILNEKDFYFVRNLIQKPMRDRQAIRPFLLHGDCGVHNFIFNKNLLSGVIDPLPVIGDPIYDLIYAFCSSPDDLTKETLDFAVCDLNIRGYKISPCLYENVVIGLYLRIRTCIRHHPADLEEYLKAWENWKGNLRMK